LNALSIQEEKFHFGMWAINKSPLIIGAALDPKRLNKASLEILSNKEVIAINQDSLAKQTQLVRRNTENEWDIWLGELSGSRQVIGVANWKNDSQIVNFDLASLGIASGQARDIWAAKNVGVISGTQNITLAGHELRLWVLSNITVSAPLKSTTYYNAAKARTKGSARVSTCLAGTCLPTGTRVGNIVAGAGVTFSNVTARSAGKKLIGVDFINYDYAFGTAWGWGDNARNMTVAINGRQAKRWAFPLSGGSWNESGRLVIEADGFTQGAQNVVTFEAFRQNSAPDLVGFEVLE
jgi:alpha-galactosidase